MSYDEMGSTKYPCPCGKGTYTETRFMDDWNRTKSEEVMNCPKCKKIYVLDYFDSSQKGISSTSARWVRKDVFEKAESLINESENLLEEAEEIAEKMYLEKWLNHFMKIGDKKRIWKELTSDGKRYPSLGTFYKHTKEESIEDYLKRNFLSNCARKEDFEQIENFLKIKDKKVIGLLKKSESKLAQAQKIKGQ